ncbi:MAG: hypothetical protein KA289_02680, partial [Kaistella sp.]|nr:hypothetical protein [Kaistella sp.]
KCKEKSAAAFLGLFTNMLPEFPKSILKKKSLNTNSIKFPKESRSIILIKSMAEKSVSALLEARETVCPLNRCNLFLRKTTKEPSCILAKF